MESKARISKRGNGRRNDKFEAEDRGIHTQETTTGRKAETSSGA